MLCKNQGCQMAYLQTKKIPICVNLGGSCNGRCGSILRPYCICVDIWYISPVLVCCINKNLATLRVIISRTTRMKCVKSWKLASLIPRPVIKKNEVVAQPDLSWVVYLLQHFFIFCANELA
jgi:hypothetical protein